ncbi:hypothetical protein DPMN_039861 [Dreissena polymorpha]|uniref:Uncharacterized protein n=1 Tax=Dreissena polymorpha TaxID=45954 RepID=A0A9D4HUN5_DREPO|nr:hypothetical protein DPMN_039861 [Dreissena polymorpha]
MVAVESSCTWMFDCYFRTRLSHWIDGSTGVEDVLVLDEGTESFHTSCVITYLPTGFRFTAPYATSVVRMLQRLKATSREISATRGRRRWQVGSTI